MSPGVARRIVKEGGMRLRVAVVRGARAKQLRPIELRPVELLLNALECRVADRAVGPQRDQSLPLRFGRRMYHGRVRVSFVAGYHTRLEHRSAVAASALSRDVIFGAL